MVNSCITKDIYNIVTRNSIKFAKQNLLAEDSIKLAKHNLVAKDFEPINIFSESTKSTRIYRSPNQNWFFKLFNISHNNYVKEQNKHLLDEVTNFYKETQNISDIMHFETNKSIIAEYLKKTPKELFLTKKEYREFINLIKQKGLVNNINADDLPLKYKQIYKELKILHKKSYDEAEQIYYNQHGILNPDLITIKSKIKPRKISLGKQGDIVPRLGEPTDSNRYTLAEIKKILSESNSIILENDSFLKDHYEINDVYDLPFKFASASYNSYLKNGNAYIKNEVPKLFQDINETELWEAFDILSTHLRGKIMSSFPKNSILTLKIGGKDFDCISLGHGLEGSVFRISKKGEKPVILKTYFADSDCSRSLVSFAPSGLYGGLGILREANLAKVIDVPRLYMANPIYKPIDGVNSRYMGAWQIVEDAKTCKHPGEGLKFRDWLEQKGLKWDDDKTDAWINGICVDTGFIRAKGAKSYLNGCWGDSGINKIYSRYLNGESTEQILNFLNNSTVG
ncbi:MAG: hypothetical protein MJ231_02420 [bacterium]|nr:hypothetical protein [bacterium]